MYGIRLSNGDVLYTDAIFEAADRYAETLPPDRDLTEPETFSAMVSYLNAELFNGECRPDLDDVGGLDEVWKCYVELCGKSKQVPTLLEFAVLIGISRETLRLWENGDRRQGDERRVGAIKRWRNVVESSLARKTIASNSVGGMFALKCVYGWRENSPQEEPEQIAVRDTVEAIRARHQGAALPPKPELD